MDGGGWEKSLGDFNFCMSSLVVVAGVFQIEESVGFKFKFGFPRPLVSALPVLSAPKVPDRPVVASDVGVQ